MSDLGIYKNAEEAWEHFKNDRFAATNGIVIDEVGDDVCVCSMVITDNHRNALGAVMGGAIFTLADFAFAVASNNRHDPTVGQQVTVNYLSGTRGSRLIARASCRKDGKTICVYNVDVSDDLGRDIAQFIGTGYKL